MKEFKCKYCGKETKPLGLSSHERLCPSNPSKKKEDHPSFGRKGTNQFIKNPNLRISEEVRLKISKSQSGKKLSNKHKEAISKAMKKAVKENPESYSASNVSGRVKLYEYNGIKLKGTWELIVAMWLDSQSIKWTNSIDPFEYEWNGSTHLYFPDFYLEDYDLYIEVKGYKRERDLSKWEVLDNLLVIKDCDIKKIKQGLIEIKDLINTL